MRRPRSGPIALGSEGDIEGTIDVRLHRDGEPRAEMRPADPNSSAIDQFEQVDVQPGPTTPA